MDNNQEVALLTQHTIILFAVCVAFIVLLLYSFIRASLFHKSFLGEVRVLRSNFEQGSGSLPPDLLKLASWLGPFVSATKNSFHLTHARDAATRSLEELLASQRDFLKLQKLLTAAPLIGVLLTAVGFITVEADLSDIQALAVPLVGGVATGASLALFSQLLLYFVELSTEKSRCEGQTLIDEIWVSSVEDIGDPHRAILSAIGNLDIATSALTTAIGDFPERIPALTEKFNEIHGVSKEVFTVLAGIIPELRLTSSDWRAASSTLKESTETRIIPSYKSLLDTTLQLRTATSEFSGISEALRNTVDGLSSASAEQKNLHSKLLESSKNASERHSQSLSQQAKQLEDSQKHLTASVLNGFNALLSDVTHTFKTHLAAIQSGTEEIKAPLKETASFLSAATPGLKDSSEILILMAKAAKDFSETINKTILPGYSSLKLFETHAKAMEIAVVRLSSSLDSITSASQAGQQFSELIKRRALPTVEVLQRATGSFEDSVNLLSECTRELSNAVDELTKRKGDLPSEDQGELNI